MTCRRTGEEPRSILLFVLDDFLGDQLERTMQKT